MAFAAKTVSVISPNRQLKVDIQFDGGLQFNVVEGNHVIIDGCRLALTLSGETLGERPILKGIRRYQVSESIKREVPIKNAIVSNDANGVRLLMKDGWEVEFRAYDSGVAYRFVTARKGRVTVDDELMLLPFDPESKVTMSQCNSFRENYEQPYVHLKAADYKTGSPMN